MKSATRKEPRPVADPLADARALHERIGELHLATMKAVSPASAEETARQWLSRQQDREEAVSNAALMEASILAVDLETFTPSLKGATAVDRAARREGLDRSGDAAYAALKAARFLPFVLRNHGADGGVCGAENLVTRQAFTLLDNGFPPSAVGVPLVGRVAALGADLFGTAGMVTPLDDAGLAVVLEFVRPGRGIVGDHRCAAAVYRHVVRHGNPRIAGLNDLSDEDLDGVDEEDAPHPVDLLAKRVLDAGRPYAVTRELLDAARKLASIESALETLFRAAKVAQAGVPELAPVYRRFAEVQVEALHLRALAGTGSDRLPLETLAQAIDEEIALRDYPVEARDLFRDIRRVVAAPRPVRNGEDLGRVIERIRGLRAKTIDQGCTEDEALAAADKVAELLDRYGLSLGEIELREQACQGVGIDSSRKRAGPLEGALPSVAHFCDCRSWTEQTADGTIRTVFFGLPADVEAARFLHERIAAALGTETETFRSSPTYTARTGGGRQKATTSFQHGLIQGICAKLDARKAARDAKALKATGRDLVPVKASVVDDEFAKLGMSFTMKEHRGRMVLTDAFAAGQVAGARFEIEDS